MSQSDDLEQVRSILLGENAAKLDALQTRINSKAIRTKDITEVLDDIIFLRQKEKNFPQTLAKPITDSLQCIVNTDPEGLSEILCPIIAPSIRKSITQASQSFVATINQLVEQATSFDSIFLRFKAFRSGLSYTELALRNSLIFSVKHVFLIDRGSGLLLAEQSQSHDSSLESDAISAMLSAIQSFVQDSFTHNKQDYLTQFTVGDHNVWVTHSAKTMLACVIYGTAPESLKIDLADTLDTINAKYINPLNTKVVNTSPIIKSIKNKLEPLVQVQLKNNSIAPKKNSSSKYIKKIVISALFMAPIIYYGVSMLCIFAHKTTINHYLQKKPGIIIKRIHYIDDKFSVSISTDPGEKIPYDIFAYYGISKEKILLSTRKFQSLEKESELIRFSKEFSSNTKGNMKRVLLRNNIISLEGVASLDWLLLHDARLKSLVSQKRLNIDNLFVKRSSIKEWFFESKTENENLKLAKQLIRKPWSQINLSPLVH